MAEEEKIREHAKHALQDLTDKNKKWKDRIKDFAWEVFIIIVAVNITLLFHSWSEKRQERELEKNFLIGIRSDLVKVNQILEYNIVTAQPWLDYADSVLTQMKEHRIDKAFVDSNSRALSSFMIFSYDNSRFENFKSSGYLRLIENDSLSMAITGLYTVTLPEQKNFDNFQADLLIKDSYAYGSKAQIDLSSGETIISNLLNSSDGIKLIYSRIGSFSMRKIQKQVAIKEVEGVINKIDRELKSRFNYQEK